MKKLLFILFSFMLAAGAQSAMAAIADTSVSVSGSYVPYPRPAKNTGPALFVVTVTNNGPDAATNVQVISTAYSPTKSVYFQSQVPSQGSCTGSSGSTCSLGTIASGATATIQFEVTTFGTNFDSYEVTETSVVSSDETDLNHGNNSASATVRVK